MARTEHESKMDDAVPGRRRRGGEISPQLRLVLNLRHITQLVMFYSSCIVPETVERASEMNRHQMGAWPARDAVVPPVRLCGTGTSGGGGEKKQTTNRHDCVHVVG